jgi:cyclopropane-fatty-acyl-phospholipid synthase
MIQPNDVQGFATPEAVRALKAPATMKVLLLAALGLERGVLDLETHKGEKLRFGGVEPGAHARIVVRHPRMANTILLGGDIGFAESFMNGDWETPDLSAVLTVFSDNGDKMDGLIRGGFWMRALNGLRHAFNANTKAGSKRNILAHYDLGNDFYSAWLDPSMTYSSARFETPDQTLNEAQLTKYRALAREIGLKEGQHVLEIGAGWGGFAEVAAREFGAKVTGLTISNAQYAFAQQRMQKAGLNERVDLRLQDYRDERGSYDHVVSIEMFEAVGEEYWPTYFGKVRDVLKPGGSAGLQVITIRDDLFQSYRSRADFIQRYIFPGGMLPSIDRLSQEMSQAGLTLKSTQTFGIDYATTLAEWGERFQASWKELTKQGFDERFRRLWTFYLSYCEAGFRTGRTDVGHFVAVKA